MANQLLFGNVFALRKQRVYRDRIELATLSDRQIRSRFRFKRESIQFISDLLRNDLSHTTRRSQPISVEMQVYSLEYYLFVRVRQRFIFLSNKENLSLYMCTVQFEGKKSLHSNVNITKNNWKMTTNMDLIISPTTIYPSI